MTKPECTNDEGRTRDDAASLVKQMRECAKRLSTRPGAVIGLDYIGMAKMLLTEAADVLDLMSPDGTKLERHDRVIEIAKRMGFAQAEPHYWGSDEYEIWTRLEDVLDGDGCLEVQSVGLGINLMDQAHGFQDYEDPEDRYVGRWFDRKEDAEAAAAEAKEMMK